MEYLLQICYIVKTNKVLFDPKEAAEQCDQLSNEIEALLPEEFDYRDLCAKKTASSLIELREGENCLRCEMCGDYVSMLNSNALSSIPEGVNFGEKILCKHCAWTQKAFTTDT